MLIKFIIQLGIYTTTIFVLSSCRTSPPEIAESQPTHLPTLHPEDRPMSPDESAKLVKIADAPDVCPNYLCPVGTKLYLRNGILMGQVVESSSTMSFPSGTKKPGMTIVRPRQTPPLPIQHEMDTSSAQIYYLKP